MTDPARLRPRVLKALQNPTNELWLSPISVWELLILVEKGRIALDGDVEEWIGQALNAAPVKEAPLTLDVVLASRKISLPQRDPADTFIAATARVFDLTLVTSDARLISSKEISVLSNR